jgi:hypothetical protein
MGDVERHINMLVVRDCDVRDNFAGHINYECWDPVAMTAGCTAVSWVRLSAVRCRQRGMSGTVSPVCVRGLLGLAARYTELTEKQPKGSELKGNTTVLKRYFGTVVSADCTAPTGGCKEVSAELAPCLNVCSKMALLPPFVIAEILSGPSLTLSSGSTVCTVKRSEGRSCRYPRSAAANSAVSNCNGLYSQVKIRCRKAAEITGEIAFAPVGGYSYERTFVHVIFRFRYHRLFQSDFVHTFCHQNST